MLAQGGHADRGRKAQFDDVIEARVGQRAACGFGASRDTPEQLKKFKDEYRLSYALLSDPEGQLAKSLGVPPGMRQTVIVTKEGKLERVITTVAAKTHPQDLLKEFEARP